MATKLTHEQKGILDDQLFALRDKAVNGIRDFEEVRRALQNIIEGKFPSTESAWPSYPPATSLYVWEPPSWWRTPEQQLERARQLWPGRGLPEPSREFVPQTKTEVLLLHVPDMFNSLWDKVNAPTGYTKYRWEGVKSDKRNLRLAPNKVEFTEPVWLAFDPEHGKGERPDSYWGQADLAASEVFSALIQFPEWSLAWFNGASAPNLTGYQLKYGSGWSNVLYADRWVDDRQLGLNARLAGYADDLWSSPRVREC